MLIRKFKDEDADEVSSLIRRALIKRDNRAYSLEQLYSICNYYSADCLRSKSKIAEIYVSIDNGLINGVCMLKGDELIIYILPENQRKGLGSKLMLFLENAAISKGLSKAILVAAIPSVEFYKKLGYSFVSEKMHPEWGKGIMMEKKLR